MQKNIDRINEIAKRLPNKETSITIAERAFYLEQEYGDNIDTLFAYGSLVFGKPRKKSIPDFLVIIKDIVVFHKMNEDFYASGLTIPSNSDEQIKLNELWPNFYNLESPYGEMKAGVMSKEYYLNAIYKDNMFIQGRIQKPLGILWSSRETEEALLFARRKGALHALNLLPVSFSFREFAEKLSSLSYLSEIRPENINRKIKDIVETGYSQFESIYKPILNEVDYIKYIGEEYKDTRSHEEKEKARNETLDFQKKQKWAWKSIKRIFQNAINYKHPLNYIVDKIKGEINKTLIDKE
ncbi:MAG: hypothetical protein JXA60_03020 [Candidatus Coatesbacteria bacterium]|nr:hypothetical protein [Candidatus Coatesbacteria bacterium]